MTLADQIQDLERRAEAGELLRERLDSLTATVEQLAGAFGFVPAAADPLDSAELIQGLKRQLARAEEVNAELREDLDKVHAERLLVENERDSARHELESVREDLETEKQKAPDSVQLEQARAREDAQEQLLHQLQKLLVDAGLMSPSAEYEALEGVLAGLVAEKKGDRPSDKHRAATANAVAVGMQRMVTALVLADRVKAEDAELADADLVDFIADAVDRLIEDAEKAAGATERLNNLSTHKPRELVDALAVCREILARLRDGNGAEDEEIDAAVTQAEAALGVDADSEPDEAGSAWKVDSTRNEEPTPEEIEAHRRAKKRKRDVIDAAAGQVDCPTCTATAGYACSFKTGRMVAESLNVAHDARRSLAIAQSAERAADIRDHVPARWVVTRMNAKPAPAHRVFFARDGLWSGALKDAWWFDTFAAAEVARPRGAKVVTLEEARALESPVLRERADLIDREQQLTLPPVGAAELKKQIVNALHAQEG